MTWAAGAVLMGAALWRVARSEYLFVQGRRDRAALEEACRLDPRRVEACVSAAWQEIQAGDHEAAQRMLLRLLENSPYYYPAIKLAGQDAWARGRREEGCLYLWIYDGLFQERSSVHGSVATHCSPALLGSFAGRVRMPRYERLPAPPAD